MINIDDVLDGFAMSLERGASLDEVVDTYINRASHTVHQQILDEIGDIDLSEPKPDLRKGWSFVRGQLAYNALYAALCARIGETQRALAEDERQALRDGDLLRCVKLIRNRTGLGLAESKRIMDAARSVK